MKTEPEFHCMCIGGPLDGKQSAREGQSFVVMEDEDDYAGPPRVSVNASVSFRQHYYRRVGTMVEAKLVFLWLHESIPDLTTAFNHILETYRMAVDKQDGDL